MQKHLKNGTCAVKRVGWPASLLRKLKPAVWRALLAADLVADGLTVATACEVSGASVGYLTTLLRLTPQELEAVSDGSKSLSSFHTPKRCSICKNKYTGFGNNAWPVNNGRCCDDCNGAHVIPARFQAHGVAVTNGNAGHHHHDSDDQVEREAQVRAITPDQAAEAWRSWSPGQRIAFGQGTGISELWDHSIVPVMAVERAAVE